MSQSQPLPARPKCSLPLPFIESDVDDEAMAQQEDENAENLLNEYSKDRNPPSKKFKVDVEDIDGKDETEPAVMECLSPPPKAGTSSRNPFKKESNASDSFQSPTKITPANSSLIKNQSPIKAIDFRRLEKLSRFKRTESLGKQNVISRFFVEPKDENASNHVEDDKRTAANDSAPEKMEIEEQVEELVVLEPEVDSTTGLLYASTSGDSAISLGISNGSTCVREVGTASGGGESDEINKKTDFIRNSIDAAIVLSDTDETSEEGPSSQPKNETRNTQLQNGIVSILRFMLRGSTFTIFRFLFSGQGSRP